MKLINRLPTNIARLSLVIMLLGSIAIGLAACGGGADATPTAPGTTGGNTDVTPATSDPGGSSSGSAQEVKASLNEWSVTMNVDQVNAGKVKFMVSNEGQFGHDFAVQDASGTSIGQTPVFKKDDGTKELDVDLKPGTYTVICDVPGHTAKGMKTTLTVK